MKQLKCKIKLGHKTKSNTYFKHIAIKYKNMV